MACLLQNGRMEPCKEQIGGISAIYIMNFADNVTFIYNDDGEIADFYAVPDLYKFELRGANSYTENITVSKDNGTAFYQQQLSITLKKIDNTMTTALKALVAGRVKVFVHMNNGELILAGEVYGMDVTGGTIVSGSALGDLYGYTLTLEGNEKNPGVFVSGATATDPFAGIETKPIIITE